MSKNPVVHFEMGYFERERMKKFYETAFGWNLEQMGADHGNYVRAETAEVDDKGMVKTPWGAINGGFYQKTDNPLSHAPSVVISVQDIKSAMRAVEAGGGKILGAMGRIRRSQHGAPDDSGRGPLDFFSGYGKQPDKSFAAGRRELRQKPANWHHI